MLALLLALLLLLLPSTASSLTPAGTVVTHGFTAQFKNPLPNRASSNLVEVTIKDLTDPAIVPPRSAVTLAGQPADFLHTVTNRGNTPDSFRLAAVLLRGAQPDNQPAPKMEFYAADGKTPLPVDASGLPVVGPIASGASVDVVLRVTPAEANTGTVQMITVTATSVQFPARNSSLRNQLLVPAPGGLVAPVKTVYPEGGVLPGTTLSYSMTIINPSLVPLTGVRMTDILNPLLVYEEGSAALPAGLAGTTGYDAASRTLSLDIPSVPAGYSGVATFRASVRSDAPGGSSIANIASMTSDSSTTPRSSNVTVSTVLSGALQLVKQAGSAAVEVGDLVPYTIQVRNVGATALTNVTIGDKLPQGFRYLKGSSVIDGVTIGDPNGVGQQVTWNIGTVAAGTTRTLSYRCAVSGDAPHGVVVNWASASAVTAAGVTVNSPPASASTRVRSSILGDKAIILGRVFEDRNCNGVPDAGEPGIAGVRIYLEDGSYVFTDREGQYSFTGVAPGIHVAKIDRITLASRYYPIPFNTAFAGVGWSQFITVPFGGPARGDFALAVKDDAAEKRNNAPPVSTVSSTSALPAGLFIPAAQPAPTTAPPVENANLAPAQTPRVANANLDQAQTPQVEKANLAPAQTPQVANANLAAAQTPQVANANLGPAQISQVEQANLAPAATPATLSQPSGAPAATSSGSAFPAAEKASRPPAPPALPLASADALPAQLLVTPDNLVIPADGKTVVPLTVELLSKDGRRIPGARTVTVAIGKGVLLDQDQDPTLPGHQLLVKDGVSVFRVRSTSAAGQDQITVSGDNGTRAKVSLFFPQELRDWILVGLGSLTVGSRGVSGNLRHIDNEDRFDQGIYTEERLAFFTRGQILGKYLLTAAYDSNKERRDGVFQMIDPEKYYPVYGDASDIGYEAQSRGKLYLKLEADRSYLLAGDYRTDLSENEFSRYDRALNGVKVEYNTEHLDVKGFESRTEETLVKDEIRGNGTSGYYFLSRRPVFENSERVRIEVRDRYHTERIILVTEKLRYADYTIDYNAGTILFKEPIPSLDQYLNPVTIVVNYQSQPGGNERYVYGGRALLKSATGSYLGGTAVVEQGAVKDTTLFGVDGGLKFGDRLSFKGEGAWSDTPEKGRGTAWKTELTTVLLDSLTLGGYYRKVDSTFLNRSMTGSTTETGTEKYSGRLDYRGLADTLLFAESFVQKDQINGVRQYGNQAGLLRKFSLFEGEAGFKTIEEEQRGAEGRSNILYGGIKGALTPQLDFTLRRDQLLGSSSVAEYQSRTFLKLDYRLNDTSRAFLTEEYQEGSPVIRHATRLGVESRLSERMRLTTGYQLSSGIAGSSEQSSVDLNTNLVDRDGLRLSSRTGYQIENSMSQERGQAILGLNSRYRVAEGFYLNSSLERVQTVEGRSGTRTAFALATEYLRDNDLKATGRYEIRSGPDQDSSLYGASIAYKATRSLTLLGKANYYDSDTDFLGRDRILDSYLGSAFRPLADNPLQLLSLLRYKIEDHPFTGRNRSLIVSSEPTFRMVKNWTLQGKYAGKVNWAGSGGHNYQSYTDLFLAGLSYDIAQKWDLGVYLRLMNQYDTGQHDFGSVVSAGYRVYRNVIISAGYNYARLDDRDLTGETYQGQGPFVGVKVKFDEDMFDGSTERQVHCPPAPTPPQPVQPEMPPVVLPLPPKPPPERPAVLLAFSKVDEPLRVSGSAELLTLLVNGERVRLPSEVSVTRERLEGPVNVAKGKPAAAIGFVPTVERPDLVKSWTLAILDAKGDTVRSLNGSGAPAARISAEGLKLEQGEIYQYQLHVTYLDGSRFSSGRELFGVNRSEALLLTLAGGSFVFDHSELTAEGRRLLKGAARVLREHPQEKVIVEGHTDWVGTVEYNIGLSKRRCDSAADYLVREEGIAPSRLVRRWYGKSRPIADNRSAEGRQANRRVELKGDFQQMVPVAPKDRYRTPPFVVINEQRIPVDPQGRFETSVTADKEMLSVEMGDSTGRSLATAIPVPAMRLVEPAVETLVHYGSSAGGVTIDEQGNGSCTLAGDLQQGSYLEVDGRKVPVDERGGFKLDVPLSSGEEVLGVVLRNDTGCSKLMNLKLVTKPKPASDGGTEP